MTNVINLIGDRSMKIFIDREGCIGCGTCEALCPKVFKLLEDGKSSIVETYQTEGLDKGEVGPELSTCVEDAKTNCPVQVIKSE
jgi:ferredoxin